MKRLDKALGIDTAITRRDFVGSMLIGAGSALLGCTSPAKQLFDKTSRQYDDPWTVLEVLEIMQHQMEIQDRLCWILISCAIKKNQLSLNQHHQRVKNLI